MSTPESAAELPFSPAAERNAPAILAILRLWLPGIAQVLELASGTGQHAHHLAGAQPGWSWQPSERRSEALAAVSARCDGLPNVRQPVLLDVMEESWPVAAAAFDALFVANLLHISPWAATPALMHGAARCLRAGGVLVIYGPFVIEGEPLAPSNVAFDADLRARDPSWGLRALGSVTRVAEAAGLQLAKQTAMPANNLMLLFTAA